MSLLALFHSTAIPRCQEFHLVLEAVGIDSQVADHEGRFYLLVDEAVADEAYEQLLLYVNENAPEETIQQPLKPFKKGLVGAYLYGLILLLVGALKSSVAFNIDWQAAGLAHSEKIFDGQWWRSITALSLHADIAHLAGNIGFGVLFGLLVAQYIGSGAAWFTILLAGALGNALNAYLYQTLHLSIGASTMVFAALGMLGVFALNDRYAQSQRGLRRWAPFFATIALLGFLGTTGERTDLMAHLTGYFCGCLLAVGWLFLPRQTLQQVHYQQRFAAAAIGLFIGAWILALTY